MSLVQYSIRLLRFQEILEKLSVINKILLSAKIWFQFIYHYSFQNRELSWTSCSGNHRKGVLRVRFSTFGVFQEVYTNCWFYPGWNCTRNFIGLFWGLFLWFCFWGSYWCFSEGRGDMFNDSLTQSSGCFPDVATTTALTCKFIDHIWQVKGRDCIFLAWAENLFWTVDYAYIYRVIGWQHWRAYQYLLFIVFYCIVTPLRRNAETYVWEK